MAISAETTTAGTGPTRSGGSHHRFEGPHGREEASWVPVDGAGVFCVTHLPPRAARLGLVVCSPLLAEHASNYRREVVLARTLAANGIVVRRFHPRGTGRSGGDAAALTFGSMREDAAAVTADLLATTGIRTVALLGTRAAAGVAAGAAPPGAPLVLWKPAVDHAAYFREVFRSVQIHTFKEDAERPERDPLEELRDDGMTDVVGYPVHRALYDSFVDVRLADAVGATTRSVLLIDVTRAGRLGRPYERLVTELRAAGHTVEVEVIAGQEAWWFSLSGRQQRLADPSEQLVADTAAWLTTLVGSGS